MSFLLDLLFPKICVGCKYSGVYICFNCIQTITQKELVCCYCNQSSFAGTTHPLLCGSKNGIDGIWSLGAYEGVLKGAIQKLKYKSVRGLAQELAELLVAYIEIKDPLFLSQVKRHPKKWVITEVPLSRHRQNQRGFNQSELLAKALADILDLRYSNLLKRTRNTRPQVGLEASLRKQNVKNAFALTDDCSLSAVNYILVDDVWTTGATLKECAKVLKIKAKKVWAITVAH